VDAYGGELVLVVLFRMPTEARQQWSSGCLRRGVGAGGSFLDAYGGELVLVDLFRMPMEARQVLAVLFRMPTEASWCW